MTYARVLSYLAARIEESLDLSLCPADLGPASLPDSVYADEAKSEEEEVALRLQRQLVRAA